jgi:hypothetical protein
MSISSRTVPHDSKITTYAEPVLGHRGIISLSPKIASIFARWSALEKLLNQLFTLVTESDPGARAKFDKLKGWDNRVERIVEAAAIHTDPVKADLTKAVLRLIKIPAGKRDELAHRIWAIADGFEDQLVLLPADDQHRLAEHVVAAKKAGTSQVPIDNKPLYDGSSLVCEADLDKVINELKAARDRMDNLIMGHYYPPSFDMADRDFSDYREKLAGDIEVSDRIKNMALARAKRTARRRHTADSS